MADARIGRRQLMGAGALGAVAAVGLPAVAQASGLGDEQLEGAWLITAVSATGAPTVQAIQGFAAGGVAVAPADSQGNPASLGAWRKTGGNGFVFNALNFFGPPGGAAVGTVTVNAAGTVKSEAMSGSYTVVGTTFDGHTAFSDHGSFTGTRINAVGP